MEEICYNPEKLAKFGKSQNDYSYIEIISKEYIGNKIIFIYKKDEYIGRIEFSRNFLNLYRLDSISKGNSILNREFYDVLNKKYLLIIANNINKQKNSVEFNFQGKNYILDIEGKDFNKIVLLVNKHYKDWDLLDIKVN